MKRSLLLCALLLGAATAARADYTTSGTLVFKYYQADGGGYELVTYTVPGTVYLNSMNWYDGFTPGDDSPVSGISDDNTWTLYYEDPNNTGWWYFYTGTYVDGWPTSGSMELYYVADGETPPGGDTPPLPEEGPIPIQPPLVPSGPVGPA